MAGMIFPDDIDFSMYETETEGQQNVKSASLYVQFLLDRLESPVKEKRVHMPWAKTHKLMSFAPGEVTIWAGPNGSGKSIVTGQVALGMCAQDEKVGIASFEMKPAKTLERMGRQWTGFNLRDDLMMSDPLERRTAIDLYEQFRDWTDGKMWLYDQQGTVHWKRVCGVARYCAKELGITQFFVDNLMKCVMGEDDYNGQKAFVDELTAIARDHGIHIHLIHHIKKPANEDHVAGKYDLKGSGAITDLADNVITVWRNKTKERNRQANKIISAEEADTKLLIDKQRNGEFEGLIGLYYLPQSQQFVAGHNHKHMKLYAHTEDHE